MKEYTLPINDGLRRTRLASIRTHHLPTKRIALPRRGNLHREPLDFAAGYQAVIHGRAEGRWRARECVRGLLPDA